ncbi:helix-turn-helix transcriptional regulator [Streptomyces sp. 6-11-2]|uniref:helix-turn-helix transcriptional regulator n=1 Tax=Streptomyces sp. 6-11-2 TaxID=2585753 RepID=UPI00114255CF|nr:helix-turn-helix transcriptional regulator [Streptomyces sp. 6-11-2]GED85799.1 hypothetical protein TNCT6_28840 [Streptomyces sp. 6-11-2]
MTDLVPHETFQQALSDFAKELVRLRISRGGPSLREISRLTGEHGRNLAASTLSEIFNGVRLPELDSLMSLVRALLAFDTHGAGHVGRNDPRLEEWRTHWKRLKVLQTESGGVSEPSPAEQEPIAGIDEFSAPSPAVLLNMLESQLGKPLSEDEHRLLNALAFPTASPPGGQVDLSRIAETAVACFPESSAGHITSVLRSLIARNFLLTGRDSNYAISDAALRALARRRMP